MGCFTALCFGTTSTSKRSKTRSTAALTRIEDQNMKMKMNICCQCQLCHEQREINQVLRSCLYSSTGTAGTDDEEIMYVRKNDDKAVAAEEELLKSNDERKKVAYHALMIMINSSRSREELKLNNTLVFQSDDYMEGQQEEEAMKGETREIPPMLFPTSVDIDKEEERSLSVPVPVPVPTKTSIDAEVDDAAAAAAADSSASSLFTYPTTNHRNCTTSDDDDEVMGEVYGGENAADSIDKCKINDADFVHDSIAHGKINYCNGRPSLVEEEQESSESLFSLSIDSRNKMFFASEIELGEKEVSSPFKLSISRGQCVHNPIENMSQWRGALEEKTISSLKDQEKENLYLQQLKAPHIEEIFMNSSKQHSMRQTPKEDENAVDTSLSSWLMASGKSKTNENSPVSVGNSSKRTNSSSSRSFDTRPVFGALTLDELKQQSRFSAPRHSPSQSSEDMPIIGTVGSYWMHTGQCIQVKHSCRKTSCISLGQCIELNSSTPTRKTSPGQCIQVNSNIPSKNT